MSNSSTAYAKYLQQSSGLGSAIQGIEGNLYQDHMNKYQNEAQRELTKKTLDVGRAAFDTAQGEALITNAVGLGTAGLAAIQGGKKVIGAVRKTYGKHYGKPDEGEEEQVAEGDEGESLDRVGQGGGVREGEGRAAGGDIDGTFASVREEGQGLAAEGTEAAEGVSAAASQAAEGASSVMSSALGHGTAAATAAKAERPSQSLLGGMLRSDQPMEIEMMEGGDYNRTRAEAQRFGIRRYANAPEGQSGAAAGEMSNPISAEVGEGAEGITAGAESSARSALGGLGEAAMAAVPEGVTTAGGFVGDLALQALPFVGEAVDLGLLAYGVYQGVEQYQKGQEEQKVAAGDPTNPPANFGISTPSLNNSVAIPIFDSSRGHDSGHMTAF